MTAGKTAVIIGAVRPGSRQRSNFCAAAIFVLSSLRPPNRIGGISCTIEYKGNRMDIGGHRFFSKADRVMDWWTALMPVATAEPGEQTIRYQNRQRSVAASANARQISDLVMLVRPRKSRIYFLRSFFDYPLALNGKTLGQLGLWRTLQNRPELSPRQKLFPRKAGEDARGLSDQPLRPASFTAHFSSPIQKRCGACRATTSARSGERSGSKGFLCARRFRTFCGRPSGARAEAISRRRRQRLR